MSKAILVIDKLDMDSCYGSLEGVICPLFNEEKMACQYLKNTKEEYCPLKKPPRKYKVKTLDKEYIKGWNDCFQKILGEDNNE